MLRRTVRGHEAQSARVPAQAHRALACRGAECVGFQRRTWHDWPLWEVASEKVVIDGDTLVANSVLLLLPLNHTVYQQEGVSAGQGWGVVRVRAGVELGERCATEAGTFWRLTLC